MNLQIMSFMNFLVCITANHNFPESIVMLLLWWNFFLNSTSKQKSHFGPSLRHKILLYVVYQRHLCDFLKMSFLKKHKKAYFFHHWLASVLHEINSESVPNASMPGGLPIVRGRSPGVVLVPGVGASFLGVGVLDFRLGVEDLSFWNRDTILLEGATYFVSSYSEL